MAAIDREQDLTGAFDKLTVEDFIDKRYKKLSPILKNLFRDEELKKEGEERYSSWGTNNFTWTLEDYAHEGFQGIYVQRLFKNRAILTKRAILEALAMESTTRELRNLRRILSNARTVASLGCGPGPELVGIQAAVLEKDLQVDLSTLHFTGYDAVAAWEKFHKKLGTTFIEQNIDGIFLQNLPCVDIIILSYFASSASLSDRNPDGTSNWDEIISKSRLVIVLDTNDRHQRNSLKKRGFVNFSVNDEQKREVIVHIKITV
jgi:hypothetical protein